jgi:hypothetical protein
VVAEGLLPDNYRPQDDDVLFYSNSRQRTFATAKYFSAGFLPFANADGLYRLADLDTRMAEAMAEYEAIEDAPTAVPAASLVAPESDSRSYTLTGVQASDSTRGIVIENNQKRVRK